MAKNDKILKSTFFTRLCPQGTRRVENHHWEWFLCKTNELRKNNYQLFFLAQTLAHLLLIISLSLVPWET